MKELKVSIEQYHKYTCLKFVKRTTQRGYIHFYKGGGYVYVNINMIYLVLKYEFGFVKVNVIRTI